MTLNTDREAVTKLHICKVIFDRRTPAITDEWLRNRIEFYKEWTWRSIVNSTFAPDMMWFSCGCNMRQEDVRAIEELASLAAHRGVMGVVTRDDQHAPSPFLQREARDLEPAYVYVTRIDSDDVFAPDALQLANDCKPVQPGRVEASCFRRGYMYDVRTKQLGVYNNPSSPFHTMMIPRDVFCDPAKYAAMDYGDHSRVNSCYPTQVLPDWRFCVLIHGRNFLSTMDYANEPDTPVERSWSCERFLQQPVTFDVDDFCDKWNCLPELDALKERYPNLCCTLFTIPAKTSQALMMRAKERSWVELAWHGVTHEPNEELKAPHHDAISFKGMVNADMYWAGKCLVNGFRPPGWYITRSHIEVLNELGMWVGLHTRDEKDLGPLCQHGYYVCGARPYWHAHTSGEGQRAHSVCGNGIRETLPFLLKKWERGQHFSFVSDSILIKQEAYNAHTR